MNSLAPSLNVASSAIMITRPWPSRERGSFGMSAREETPVLMATNLKRLQNTCYTHPWADPLGLLLHVAIERAQRVASARDKAFNRVSEVP